ncbi:hypothetical protein VTJ49DRAFT_4888 [Mycothermus thermophilus]|uniref:Uncharacterized protein n=1 Tax=Humicola insolens TaxID=85995 RepID=A0ABR3V4B0_HUMIN
MPADSGSPNGGMKHANLYAAMEEAYMITHAPPDFPRDAEIIGICAVSDINADLKKYDWIVDDFYMWRHLLNQAGHPKHRQTWASTLNISMNPGDNHELDKQAISDTSDVMYLQPSTQDLSTAIQRVLGMGANRALINQTVLVVMIFAPVTPDHDICLDFQDKKVYLTTERIREMVFDFVREEPLPVMLMTPSAFTGGWCCRPSFMNCPPCDNNDKIMRLLAKSCGGAMADSFTSKFKSCSSPLMNEQQRAKLPFEDPMPLRPTDQQVNTFHQVHQQVHEALERRLSPLAREHDIILKPEAIEDPSDFRDAWSDYGPRKARQLSAWADGWCRPWPATHVSGYRFLGKAFGGTMETQLFHLKYLIGIELTTSTEDWARQGDRFTKELYQGFGKGQEQPSEDEVKRVFDMLEYRASTMTLARIIAKAFRLSFADGVKPRFWVDKTDYDGPDARMRTVAFHEINKLVDDVAPFPGESRHGFKLTKFYRPSRWLGAVIAPYFQHRSPDAVESFVEELVKPFIEQIRSAQEKLLLEDQLVTQAGRAWIAALGLDGDGPVGLPLKSPTNGPSTGLKETGAHGPANLGSFEPEPKRQVSKKLNAAAPSWPNLPLITTADSDQAQQHDWQQPVDNKPAPEGRWDMPGPGQRKTANQNWDNNDGDTSTWAQPAKDRAGDSSGATTISPAPARRIMEAIKDMADKLSQDPDVVVRRFSRALKKGVEVMAGEGGPSKVEIVSTNNNGYEGPRVGPSRADVDLLSAQYAVPSGPRGSRQWGHNPSDAWDWQRGPGEGQKKEEGGAWPTQTGEKVVKEEKKEDNRFDVPEWDQPPSW